MTQRCDILSVLTEATLARHGIVEHDVGDDPYAVTEPKAFGGRTLTFCSLAHLAWWVRAASTGADKRVNSRSTGRDRG